MSQRTGRTTNSEVLPILATVNAQKSEIINDATSVTNRVFDGDYERDIISVFNQSKGNLYVRWKSPEQTNDVAISNDNFDDVIPDGAMKEYQVANDVNEISMIAQNLGDVFLIQY